MDGFDCVILVDNGALLERCLLAIAGMCLVLGDLVKSMGCVR